MKLRYWFIVGFIAVAQSVIYDTFFMANPTKAPDIETRIEELFVDGNDKALQWLVSADDDAFIAKMWSEPLSDSWKEKGISLHLYRGDTLLFWVNHTFGFEIDSITSPAARSVEQFDGNTILSFRSSNGDKRAIVVIKLVTQYDWFNGYVFPRETDPPLFFAKQPDTTAFDRQLEQISVLGRKFCVEVDRDRHMPLMVNLVGWAGLIFLLWCFKQYMRRRVTNRNALQRLGVVALVFFAVRLLVNYVDIPNGGSFSWSSLGSLLITYGFLLIFVSASFAMRFRIRAQVKSFSQLTQYVLLAVVTIFMCVVIIYFHYSMVELIRVNTAHIEIYNIFSLNFDSFIFYVVCALFVTMRMLYSRVTEAVFSHIPYWGRAMLSIGLLVIMVIPMESYIVNTGLILVMFHSIFLSVYYLSRRQFVGRQFVYDLVVFTAYITFFSAVETFAARTVTAKEYATEISVRPNWERINHDQPPKSLWFAIISDDQMTLSENNNYELLPLLAVAANVSDSTVSRDGTTHVVRCRQCDGATVVVSFERPTFIRIISLWSYIFLWLLVVSGFILQLAGLRIYRRYNSRTMIYRVRTMIFMMVVLSMGIVSIVVYQYSDEAYSQQQKNALKVSVQELRANFNSFAEADTTDSRLMRRWLRMSNSSRTSLVSIFDTSGVRLSSVDDTFFLSRMSSDAYGAMRFGGMPYYERLTSSRNRTFAVAYTPLYWHDSKIGYMGVMHLNPQNMYRKYALLSSIFNVFVLVLLISIALSLTLYSAMTRPLNLLYEGLSGIRQMKKIKIDNTVGDDEVGAIIRQYNAMIDYLEESYAALARSEREGAWREMARQVAHEIKNPLTPMRLKIQMLQRSRLQGVESSKEQLDSTLCVLLEQIDILSRIASEFSDLARLPEGSIVRIELAGLLSSTVSLYSSSECIDIRFEDQCEGKKVYVNVDYASMSRVVVNLLQNALQAVVGVGEVVVRLSVVDNEAVIEVRDTGRGLTEEVAQRMFEPNFTTKTSGSGLGLAISRQIIENFGGKISASNWSSSNIDLPRSSAYSSGTSLIVRLPLA